MKTSNEWRVWAGSSASIWAHRGYTVRGDSVYTESRADALRIARATVPAAVEVGAGDGEVYLYASQDAADRDADGSGADAVVMPVEES